MSSTQRPQQSIDSRRGRLATFLFTTSLVYAGLGMLSSASAQTVPPFMPVEGYLETADGEPVNSTDLPAVLRLYDRAKDGVALYEEEISIRVANGRFSTHLGGSSVMLAPELFEDYAELYLGIAVNGDDEAVPRMRVGTAPYAMRAHSAATADSLSGVAVQDLQPKVIGSCPDGAFMVGVGDDGAPSCQEGSTGDITAIKVGKGLTGGGNGGDVTVSMLGTAPVMGINLLTHVTVPNGEWATITSTTIDVPGPGHVMAIGMAHANSNKGCAGTACQPEPMSATVGLTPTEDGEPFNRVFARTDPTVGAHVVPLTVSGAFPVASAGSKTIYLRIFAGGTGGYGDFSGSGSLQLIYLPASL